MIRKNESLKTVRERERERERELHFNKEKCSFVQQSDTQQ